MRVQLDKIGSVTLHAELPREVDLTDRMEVREGNVIVVKALQDKSVYDQIELVNGRQAKMSKDDVIADSQNNAYFTDIGKEHIGRIDAKTGKLTLYVTPTQGSGPRRGMMDAQDRLWFGEYRGNKIGMFDTKNEKFQEWAMPTPWSNPYDVTIDKNVEAWTGSMLNDRIVRLDPKSGQFTEYLLPKSTNVRRVFVDSSTTPVTFWVGSNHGASIIKLEPLD